MQVTDEFTDASGAMTTEKSIMKETFYEKKPTRMQRMTTTQRSTKRQYSPINKKKATVFNCMCHIFRLKTLHSLAVLPQ